MAALFDGRLTVVQATPSSEYANFWRLHAAASQLSQMTKSRPGCENAWPDVLSMAIICLSLPAPAPLAMAMPLATVPRLCQEAPLSADRATTMDAPEAVADCESSM